MFIHSWFTYFPFVCISKNLLDSERTTKVDGETSRLTRTSLSQRPGEMIHCAAYRA